MTREEAEIYAKTMTYEDALYNLSRARAIPYRKATFIKVNELIKALSQEPKYWMDNDGKVHKLVPMVQEPCDDAISRDMALEKMADYVASGYADSAEDFEEYSRIICQLPSVTQKSGKWIKVKSGDKDFPESIVCSRCSNENSHLDFNENAEPIGKVFVTSKFCPNCGAKMESEVNE